MVDLNDFFHAITAGEIGRVQQYLEEDPELVNAHNQEGLSAVLVAAYYQQPEIARLLVQNGADLNVFEASAAGSLEQVQAWCSRQPELVDAVAPDGFQPLGLAVFLWSPRSRALFAGPGRTGQFAFTQPSKGHAAAFRGGRRAPGDRPGAAGT